MKELETLSHAKFSISNNEMRNVIGGAKPGYHKFLWMTWNTSEHLNTETGKLEVCRTSDPKKVNG